ncbi:E3 ubiquitin-protein ligase RNF8-like [Rhopalosiphum padi]|uniref:E3 ubiquitin-protein ligase RNF8-like n=1 Tax=Rhopalosiphum padi TaxID=40932 RepID=UPI00298E9910|nr:E3 ubiquitin-protein ligase RNF8-like [Rhopalosiphum padi]XP_060853348.1 E3 ubiquitin-protein ligase RNF8-like [Rhopalosiphum padi]
MSSKVCLFLRGSCRLGNRCWNSHDLGTIRSDSPLQIQAENSNDDEISFPMAARRETTPITASPSSSASRPRQINQVLPITEKKSPETNKTATQDKWILQNNYTLETIEGTPDSLLVETTKKLKEAENAVISLRQQLRINDNNLSWIRDQWEQYMENDLNCNICYETFIEPTVLNCSHTFCLECIESWTREANHCPICRVIVKDKSHCLTLDTYLDSMYEYLPSEIKTRRETLKVERNNNKVEVNRNPRNNARINHRYQSTRRALDAELWGELDQNAAERGVALEEALFELDPIRLGNW